MIFFTSIGEGTSHRSNSFTTVWNREHETIQRDFDLKFTRQTCDSEAADGAR